MATRKPRRDSVEREMFGGRTEDEMAKPARDKKLARRSKGGSTQMWDRKADGEWARDLTFMERAAYLDKKSGGLYSARSKLRERPDIAADKKQTGKAAKKAAVAKMMRKMAGK